MELADNPARGLHTLYISPLKALAADIARNLARPISEIGLNIRGKDRTGDTSASRKKCQRSDQLMLCLARLQTLCPNLQRTGLSATVDGPHDIARMFAPHPTPCRIIHTDPGHNLRDSECR